MRELVVDRRKVLAAAAVAGAGTVAAAVATRLPGGAHTEDMVPIDRRQAAGGPTAFANQDDSYAQAASGRPAAKAPPAPATLFASASEAAAHTKVTVPTILATDDPVVHLLRRATFGPTPATVAEVHSLGIDAWIDRQLAPDAIPDPEADTGWAAFPLASAPPAAVRAQIPRGNWDAMSDYGRATMTRQIWSRRQLYEVMVDFWSNHLNVPVSGEGVWDVGPSFHRDVVRAHALGSFTDMLLASGRHPAMLRYLSGSDSTRQAVNENWGRELLELHTVGVDGGYSEADVRNSAYILTGRITWPVPGGPAPEGEFYYAADRHWTGRVKVMGFSDANASAAGGLAVGDRYLRYLAAHPSTARTIARKLATRFVADVPPPTLVDRMAKAYLDGGTAIAPVLRIMFRSGEFWAAVGQKVRRPLENIMAAARAVGVRPGPDINHAISAYYRWAGDMGNAPIAWSAPNGYPDVHAAWRSSGMVVTLWDSHRDLVGGFDTGLVMTPPDQLAAGMPRGTVGEYVDSLCRALCLQTFRPAHRSALLAFVGAAPTTPSAAAGMPTKVLDVAALVLDSPYFMLR